MCRKNNRILGIAAIALGVGILINYLLPPWIIIVAVGGAAVVVGIGMVSS